MGATLFEALTLERPIEIHDDVAFRRFDVPRHAPLRRPSAIRPGFPEELEDVILKAMERIPPDATSRRGSSRSPDRVADRSAFRRTRIRPIGPDRRSSTGPILSTVPPDAASRSDALSVRAPTG